MFSVSIIALRYHFADGLTNFFGKADSAVARGPTLNEAGTAIYNSMSYVISD